MIRNILKKTLYSGVLCDVMDQMGYRNQALSNAIYGLNDETVIFGPAFTSIGTEVYSMPENPLTAQCKVVDQLQADEIYVLTIRGNYNCAVFGELFATAVKGARAPACCSTGMRATFKALKEMEFPLFYRGKDPRTSKGRCEINECQIPILIDGVTVKPRRHDLWRYRRRCDYPQRNFRRSVRESACLHPQGERRAGRPAKRQVLRECLRGNRRNLTAWPDNIINEGSRRINESQCINRLAAS